MSANDDETPQRFALGLVFFLVAAVVIFAIIFGIFHVRRSASAPTTESVVATVVDANADVARIEVVDGVVKFYFATGKADIAAGANEALADVLKAVAEGKSAVISGFHDATGDAALNAELAKQRAMAVRDLLKAQGAAEDKLVLQKPEQTQATGTNAEARRVENTFTVGKFLVTPLTKITDSGDYAASVSIRRGMYDRIIRFIPRFQSDALAARYALRQGCSMVLQNQLA